MKATHRDNVWMGDWVCALVASLVNVLLASYLLHTLIVEGGSRLWSSGLFALSALGLYCTWRLK